MSVQLGVTRDHVLLRRRGLSGAALLGAAMVASAVLVLVLGHDTTFSTDEIDWFASTPGLDLHGVFAPYNGHLIAGERLVYAAMFHVFGVNYLPFRVLAILTAIVVVALLFEWMRRRVGAIVALMPCLVLLVFGSDAIHLILGNGFGDLAPLALGICALFALERNNRVGDVVACVLLVAAISVYSVGLAFLGGATVLTIADPGRRRRAWVVAIPILLYVVWLVATHGQAADTGENVKPWQLLLAPVWTADSVGAVGSSLTGLNYPDFETDWKPVVAVIIAALIVLRLRRRVTPWLLATAAIPLTLWALAATAAAAGERIPAVPRYMFPGAVCLLIFGAEAARGMRFRRNWVLAIGAVAAFGIATNVVLLGKTSNGLRDTAVASRVELAAVEEAGGNLGLSPPPAQVAQGTDPGGLLWAVLGLTGENNVATGYLRAVDEFGSPAFTSAEIQALSEPERYRADQAFASVLGISLRPAGTISAGAYCRTYSAMNGGPIAIPVRGPGLGLSSPSGGDVGVRRFGSAFPIQIGTLGAHSQEVLSVPGAETATPAWTAVVSAPRVRACELARVTQ